MAVITSGFKKLLDKSSPYFDTVITDYASYTPYTEGSYDAYPNGTYYWQVEARNSSGIIISTSNNWSFSIAYKIYLPNMMK